MFRKIVVPLNGDPKNEIVLPIVQDLAHKFDADVVFLSVLPHPMFANSANDRKIDFMLNDRDTEWQIYLEKIASAFERLGIQTSSIVYEGNVADEILICAENIHADLIVMTSTHRNLFGILSLDSDVKRVARTAHIPVLLISAEADAAASDTSSTALPQRL